MRVYISGPMTGITDFNHQAFNTEAKRWRGAGHEVVNPAEYFGGDTTKMRKDYMRQAVLDLPHCDAIVQLVGWSMSKGANLEHQIAEELSLTILSECNDPYAFEKSPWRPQPRSYDVKQPERENILEEANRVVYEQRAVSYGNPEDNFTAIASLWKSYLAHKYAELTVAPLDASDVALMLVLLKVGRATTGQYKRDTAVDIAGYAECYSRINEVE